MKVIEGRFPKKDEERQTVSDMLEALRTALGTFEKDNPDVAVEGACVIFIQGHEFVLASNGLHPDNVNMLLDMGKFHLIMGDGKNEESYNGPTH